MAGISRFAEAVLDFPDNSGRRSTKIWDWLNNLAGPIRHFRAAVLEALREKVTADLCGRRGFRGSPCLDVDGTLQLLNSDHVREETRLCLGVSLLVVFGMAFCWEGKGSACAVSVLRRS